MMKLVPVQYYKAHEHQDESGGKLRRKGIKNHKETPKELIRAELRQPEQFERVSRGHGERGADTVQC